LSRDHSILPGSPEKICLSDSGDEHEEVIGQSYSTSEDSTDSPSTPEEAGAEHMEDIILGAAVLINEQTSGKASSISSAHHEKRKKRKKTIRRGSKDWKRGKHRDGKQKDSNIDSRY
jgi:hypothetical protein